MFDYFRKFSSNADHVCCTDSPTKGLYNLFDYLDVHSRSQLRLKFDKCFNLYFNSNISENISAIAFKLGTKVDLCVGYYTRCRFDNLDIDLISQCLLFERAFGDQTKD